MFVQSSFRLLKEMEIQDSDLPLAEVTNWYPPSKHLQLFGEKVGTSQELHIAQGLGADLWRPENFKRGRLPCKALLELQIPEGYRAIVL